VKIVELWRSRSHTIIKTGNRLHVEKDSAGHEVLTIILGEKEFNEIEGIPATGSLEVEFFRSSGQIFT